jgi:hypothetical protein
LVKLTQALAHPPAVCLRLGQAIDMIDSKAVDPACGVEAKNCRVNGFKYLIIFDADRSKIIDVEKTPPIDFIIGRAPRSIALALPETMD